MPFSQIRSAVDVQERGGGGKPLAVHERLTRTVWMFGSTHQGPYGAMTFAPDGRVTTRFEPNEYRWELRSDTRLALLNAAGVVTCELAPGPEESWLPVSGLFSHYLHPIFALESAPERASGQLPPVFINTVPKAGTYLAARALEQAGGVNTRLHVMDNYLHDNRNTPDDEIHWEPQLRQVMVPAAGVAAILRPGEFAVGHVESAGVMQAIEAAGVKLINVVREPRAQLLSMFVFLRRKVKPTPEAALWQSMEGLDAFKAFLASSAIRRWIAQTTVMVEHGPFLRFEDLRQGDVSTAVAGRALAKKLSKGLGESLGQKTSTLIDRDPNETAGFVEDADVLRFLDELGAMELSRQIWPERN